MKILPVLFLYLTFVAFFEGYHSSDPDSIIVQSSEDNKEKAAMIQIEEESEKISVTSEKPRGLVVSFMRPIKVGSTLIWTEVGRKRLESERDFTRLQNTLKVFQTNQSYARKATEKSFNTEADTVAVGEDEPEMPQNNVKENNAKIVYGNRHWIPQSNFRGNTRIVAYNYRPQSNIKGSGSTNGDNSGSQMPQSTIKGSGSTNGDNSGSQMPQSNIKGSGSTNGDNSGSQMIQSNIKGSGSTNGDNSGSQMPETNSRGNSGEVDRSWLPQGNVRGNNNNFDVNPQTSIDSSSPAMESEEVFFEDDDLEISGTESQSKRISPDSNFFAGIVNDFTFKLVEGLNIESNFVISPLSIYIALSMCYLGSEGRTKAQMERALGMNDNVVHGEHLHQGIKDLLSLVMEQTSGYQLFVANGMFLGKNFTVDPQFERNIRNYYDGEIKNLDFGNPQLSLQFINEWVAESTRNMITEMISTPPPLITRLILLNAIFFKGIWKTQFPVHLTYSGKFHGLNGNDKEVRFMSLFDETFPIVRSEEHKNTFIKLPYEGDQASMIIALPFSARDKPMSSIRDEILCYIRDAMTNRKIDTVAIPKFRLEYKNSIRRPLQELGVTDIFNSNAVDLRKLRKENDVYVSAIMHKAMVEIDEVGTTASAATDVRFAPLSYRNKTNFVADHPFAFYIVHEPTGLVLFYGKVFDFGSEPVAPNDRTENSRVRFNRFNSNRRG